MAVWLVAHLKGENAWVLPNELLGIRVAVVEKLCEVSPPGLPWPAGLVYGFALAVNARETRVSVLSRVAVIPRPVEKVLTPTKRQ